MALGGSPPLSLLLGVCLLTVAFLFHQKRSRLRSRARALKCHVSGPSYNHIDPLFGLDFIYENGCDIRSNRFAQGVRERFQRYGKTHYSRMGFQDIVHTVHPLNLEKLMGKNNGHYTIIPHRQKLVSLLWGNGVFTTNGDEWVISRRLAAISLRNLDPDCTIKETYTLEMVERIRSESSGGHSIDLSKIFNDFNFGLTTSLFFGEPPGKYTDRNRQFAEDFALLGQMGRALTLFISTSERLGDMLYHKRFRPAQKRLFEFVDDCAIRALQSREKPEKKASTLVEGLAATTSDVEQIRSEALNLLLAGHDTIRHTISETFWHLARSPDAWATLRSEVAAKLDGRTPTRADLLDMTYLSWIINESTRLKPTLSSHGRKAICDTTLPRGGGEVGDEALLIPKGTYIAYSNYTLHRDPEVFGEGVDEFRPERWEDIDTTHDGFRFKYLPFGSGARSCVGKDLGWTIVAYATVRLAQEIEKLEPPEDDLPWKEAASFMYYNQNGVHLRVKMADANAKAMKQTQESEEALVDVQAQG